ncbi:hypothetical protein Tco_0569864 [Tanacetum coccineum]
MRVIPHSIHSDDRNPTSANIKQALRQEPQEIAMDFIVKLPKTSSGYDENRIDDKLHFVGEPVEIMDQEAKRLKHSRVPITKVRWNSRRGPEFTWERKDQFRNQYLYLSTNTP